MDHTQPENTFADRRRMRRRRSVHDHGIVSARVWPGCDVSLLDVSAGGALIETSSRLLPGTPIELHLITRERRAAVRGDVLRCAVVRVGASGVCYHGAIGFARALAWFLDAEKSEYQVPVAESQADHSSGADSTQRLA